MVPPRQVMVSPMLSVASNEVLGAVPLAPRKLEDETFWLHFWSHYIKLIELSWGYFWLMSLWWSSQYWARTVRISSWEKIMCVGNVLREPFYNGLYESLSPRLLFSNQIIIVALWCVKSRTCHDLGASNYWHTLIGLLQSRCQGINHIPCV